MDVIWGVLCQNAIVDKNTNNISLINIREEIKISIQPPHEPLVAVGQGQGVSIDMQLVTLWVRSNLDNQESGFGHIRMVLPNGESIMEPDFPVDLTTFLRLRQIASIPSLPIRGEGIYRFVVEYSEDNNQWTQKFEIPLRVIFDSPES